MNAFQILALACFMQSAGLLAKYGLDYEPTAPVLARIVCIGGFMIGCLLTCVSEYLIVTHKYHG